MAQVEVKSSQSCTVKESAPYTADPENDIITVSNATSAKKYGLLDLDLVPPIGEAAQVTEAILNVKLAGTPPANATLSIHALDDDWDSDTETYSDMPGVRTAIVPTASLTTAQSDGTIVQIDITDLYEASLQAEDDSATRWYGVRLSVDGTGDYKFYGAFLNLEEDEPYLDTTFRLPPDEPVAASPASGKVIGTATPVFLIDAEDQDEEGLITAIQVQVSTSETFDTFMWDPGMVTSGAAETTYAGTALTAGVTYYWRGMVRNDAGIDSDWTEVESFVYQPKSAVTLTAPASSPVSNPTPRITWTAADQAAFELEILVFRDGAWQEHYFYPKTESTTIKTLDVPNDYRLVEGEEYRIQVRVWDAYDREHTYDDPSYTEVERDVILTAVTL